MSDWTDGYVADIDYTYGYYPELNPLRARLALLNKGLALPGLSCACELGFGQGLSVNIHAAASGTQWVGTDFNPAQAGFAQSLAAASGSSARLHDQAFAEFANRNDLPDFDFVGLHGIWSWISDDNRRVIVDLLRRKLKVGGILYISYNTMPGWAAFAPMRHLMALHAQTMGAPGIGTVSRVDNAIGFAEKLLATQPGFVRAHPQVSERLTKLKGQNRHYLAHEYFNADWQPMHFATMADWLAPAKLGYACSANYLDHFDGFNFKAAQQTLLKEIPDAVLRETTRDFILNQQFRRDYWVKGPRRLAALDQEQAWRQQSVLLCTRRADVPLKIKTALGEATMSEAVYAPILDLLADHQTRTLAQIEQEVKDKRVQLNQIKEAVLLLVNAGHLALAQDAPSIANAKPHTERLNAQLLGQARSSSDIAYLASPVTGGGVPLGRFQQLFLSAQKQGLKLPGEWADAAWQTLNAQNPRVIKDGKALDSPEKNLAELSSQADNFAEQKLSVLQALQIA